MAQQARAYREAMPGSESTVHTWCFLSLAGVSAGLGEAEAQDNVKCLCC